MQTDFTPPTENLQAPALDDAPLQALLQRSTELKPVAKPTAEQIAATYAAAAETLKGLAQAATPKATRLALASVLRYWSFWHRATFGEELPLICSPPASVPADVVLVFIAHHTPVVTEEKKDGQTIMRVSTGMPPWVRVNVAELEEKEGKKFAGRRRIAQRARRSASIDADVPALKTVQQRVTLLRTVHFLLQLPAPHDTDGRIRPMMRMFAMAMQRTPHARVVLAQPKQALVLEQLQKVLDQCGRDWTGIRDKALLLAGFCAGRRRSEVVDLRREHLEPSLVTLPGGVTLPGYRWSIYRLKGKVSTSDAEPLLVVPLVGAACSAMAAWLSVLDEAGHSEGPVWRRVFVAKRKGRDAITGEIAAPIRTLGAGLGAAAVNEILKKRLTEMLVADGVDPKLADVSMWGAHSLRSGYVTTQRLSGIDLASIMQVTGHVSESSAIIYDQRQLEKNPGLQTLLSLRA